MKYTCSMVLDSENEQVPAFSVFESNTNTLQILRSFTYKEPKYDGQSDKQLTVSLEVDDWRQYLLKLKAIGD